MTSQDYVALEGSDRSPPSDPRIGPAPEQEIIKVTVHLRGRAQDQLDRLLAQLATAPADARQHLTREEFAQKFGARPEDVAPVRQFAANHDLNVVSVHPERRTVELSGTVAAMTHAFGVDLGLHKSATGVYRGRSGSINVPKELASAIVAVLGLDTRPAARPHFRMRQAAQEANLPSAAAQAAFTPNQVAGLYQFPPGATGAGQCIALIELGGGFRPDDLAQYFSQLGITPPPTVVAVSVDGATNAPVGNLKSFDGEVVLDIEVAGAVAPGAKIAVYFAPNTEQGLADALLAAMSDQTNQPTVICTSWGSAEDKLTAHFRDAMNQAFEAAAAVGVPVFASAGDDGSSDGVQDQQAHVDFPAASPLVVGCGGTSMRAAGGQITSETVWNDGPDGGATGGGVSVITPVPPFQQSIKPISANPPGRPGRGVPDVAGVADPGYQILGDDTSTVTGGTSAAAPLWAALIALIQQQIGQSVAPLLPALYGTPTAFRNITQGNNGAYSAGPGWDACTGLGSPIGSALLTALRGTASPATAP
ncbi:S53 family peptidase [Mycobacterium sp. OTB74]|jgi:kumamolisin|uniref:S53 family peptidase n=1 Tax=Mycobacterium sp. OTB74 TaxID=1853452 RepID=UPI00247525A5|nr:S53 family peptidase [Mycobacterium sp. OTB74]MDH6246087.1 kumamolisin [Mycobacterium sp. OTB74]